MAEIADRAGLTELTFFRYFADQRGVSFPSSGTLQDLLVSVLAGAADLVAPLEAIMAALEGAGTVLFQPERHEHARQLKSAIAANGGYGSES